VVREMKKFEKRCSRG